MAREKGGWSGGVVAEGKIWISSVIKIKLWLEVALGVRSVMTEAFRHPSVILPS